MTLNDELFARAQRATPGGVNSPVRAFGSVGGTPRLMVSGRGAMVTDVDGREYVDLICGWGPALLGHAHPEVVAAVQSAAAHGMSFGASSPVETELAELIEERVAPVEQLRLVSTGTEATMTAIRLARGATGRDLLIKFSGHYHGHSDGLLAAAGSGLATFGLPSSAGVPAAIAGQTLVVPYNDESALTAAFAAHPGQIAAVIVEAAAANMGVVPPRPGFNAFIKRTAHEHGALMIADEVLTGFRVHRAGYWGLVDGTPDAYQPDLLTFGKVIGGGMPVAALGGSAELMQQLAPTGPVYQAGTLSGNPVAVAAGLATMRLADAGVYAAIDRAAAAIQDAVVAELSHAGVPHVTQSAGSLFSVFFGEFAASAESAASGGLAVPDYETAAGQHTAAYRAFFHSMLDQGISLPPSAFEAWFVSAAHDDAVVSRILDALPAASRAAASVPSP